MDELPSVHHGKKKKRAGQQGDPDPTSASGSAGGVAQRSARELRLQPLGASGGSLLS